MAKKKSNPKKDEELIEQDEVIYEEEDGEEEAGLPDERNFFERYRNFIVVGAVVVVAVIGILVIRSNKRKVANKEAQVEMILPTLYYEQDSLNRAINGDGPNYGFGQLEDEYSGTQSGNLMKYYQGTAYLKQGQIDLGIEYLEDFEKGSDMVSAAAFAALGYAYEQQNDFATAAENYERASRTPGENEFTTPFYLMHAARNHESAGNNEAAVEIYLKIRDRYPNCEPMTTGLVEKLIAKISPENMNG